MDFLQTAKNVDEYIEGHLIGADPVLDLIAQDSEAAGLVPHSVTPLQARFLAMMVSVVDARRVLEVGCLGGYSAVAMARALPESGQLITTEIDTRTAKIAQQNIDRSGFGDRIELKVGPALPTIDAMLEDGDVFDLVFIDADKVNHANYLEAALQLARVGTIIIADNVIRGGAVTDSESQENSVKGVRAMFELAATLKNVEMTALQTVGAKGYDGFAIFRVTEV